MLVQLSIRDIVLIERLDLSTAGGFFPPEGFTRQVGERNIATKNRPDLARNAHLISVGR